MRKYLLTAVAVLAGCITASAAKAPNIVKSVRNAKGIEVTYQNSYKGHVSPGTMTMTVIGDQVALESSRRRPDNGNGPRVPVIKSYVDYASHESLRWAQLPDGTVISCATPFDMGKGLKEIGEDKYLGLDCKIMRTSVNSNTIDIWYTTAIPFRGTPQAGVGVPDGLVLRIIRNGDQIQEATAITPLKQVRDLMPESWGNKLDAYDFQYDINHANVITVPVFDQQRINFDGAKIPEALKDGEIYNVGGGTIILKKVQLPDSVNDRDVFVEVVQYSDGDAYDRTGSVFMVPTDKKQSFIDAIRDLNSVPSFKSGDTDYHGLVSTPDYNVPMELMRFFTGFGVRAFNHNKVRGQEWVDSVNYKTEVTSLAERLVGEQWIGAYIGNWDSKGHKVSVKLKYYPSGERKSFRTMPLFNTVNYLEQAGQPYPVFLLNDSLNVKFTLKEPVKNAILYYLTTGHGGWGGGDEFNQKPNTILVDGKQVISFVPWREDCGTYRNWNPCSGNFSNGLSSSDLSRSNWCPATVTNPEYIYLGDLEAGEHTITVKIPQGAPEGGSNSYWCLSGTLLY